MKIQWESELVEKPLCQELQVMGWLWLDDARIERAIADLQRLDEPHELCALIDCANPRIGVITRVSGFFADFPIRIQFRRDQRAVCFASRAARRPVPLSTTPVPLLKSRARHELAWCRAAGAAGFRLRLGGGRCAPASFC
jgi:hypothetical protein